ncbi:MAG: dihydroorotate dehydrogenase electron transfer subunit [Candidatus Omnitrophota bacterium]
MKQLKCRILENKKIAQGFYKMRVESPYLAKNSKPGQFIEVQCSDDTEPLLRRPLGVHRISKGGIDLLYEVVGIGTALLSKKKAGEKIDLIGPLGNGFDIAASVGAAILVAGGAGIAPIMALAEKLSRTGRKVSVVMGAKKKSHLLCEGELKALGCTVKIATEDGSKGYRGLVTDLLRDMPAASCAPRAAIYSCGPAGMLKTVSKIAREKRIPCQVSLEEHMACGVGVCLGCPVKVKGGEYKMVCKDGPVFNAEEIAW